MGKQASIRVFPHLCPIFCHIGLRQYRAVIAQNLSADDSVRKAVQTRIIGIVDDRLTLHLQKIAEIAHQTNKQAYHNIGHK